MKFGQQLDSKKDLEWRDEYADYGRGRKLIKKLRAKHEKRSVGSPTLAKQAARENTVTAARENTLTEVLLPDNATATCDDAGSRVASSPSTCGTESTVTVISPVPSEQEMPECLSDEQVQAYEFAEFIVSEWRRVNGFYSRTCEEFEHALDQMCSQVASQSRAFLASVPASPHSTACPVPLRLAGNGIFEGATSMLPFSTCRQITRPNRPSYFGAPSSQCSNACSDSKTSSPSTR